MYIAHAFKRCNFLLKIPKKNAQRNRRLKVVSIKH